MTEKEGIELCEWCGKRKNKYICAFCKGTFCEKCTIETTNGEYFCKSCQLNTVKSDQACD